MLTCDFTSVPDDVFRFGVFELDVRAGELRKGGSAIKLAPQPFLALELLVRRAGELVTREELQQKVWQPGTFVDFDQGLNYCIRQLRSALNDDASRPRYIETVPKRGYRFVAPVQVVGAAGELPVMEPPASPERRRVSLWALLIAGLAIMAVGIAVAHRKPTVRGGGRMRPVTTVGGLALEPAISPDGKLLAFAWNGPARHGADIYVQPIDGGTPLRLTETYPGYAAAPQWTPDGKQVIFSRCSGAHDAIWSVPAGGGQERHLADLHQCALQGTFATLASDGDTLLFTDWCDSGVPWAVITVSLGTGQRRCLTTPPKSTPGDGAAALSPDGKRVAFVRSTTGKVSDVWVIGLDGQGERQVTKEASWIERVTWSHDGEWLIYSSARGGPMQIWRSRVDGGEPELVAGPGPNSFSASESRDGRYLAYTQSGGGREPSIWRAELKGSEYRSRQVVASAQGDRAPSLSPDGSQIAFESERTGSSRVWVANADGSNPRQLVAGGQDASGGPRWSPDGRTIAFEQVVAFHRQIATVSLPDGKPRVLTSCDCDSLVPAWSPDGRTLYFSSNRGGNFDIWKLQPPDSGKPEQVTHGGRFNAMVSWDGVWLYFNRADHPGTWRMPVGGGHEELIVDRPDVGSWGWWALSRDALFYLDGQRIMRMNVAKRSPSAAVKLEGQPTIWSGAMDVSPDGRLIYYTDEDPGSTIMLIENGR